MPAYKLLMHPANPHSPPLDVGTLAGHLTEISLIGAPVRHPALTLYAGGDRLLELVTFLGCAPHINLQPPDSPDDLEAALAAGGFCHVRLTASNTLQFRTNANAPPPRCPACRQPVHNWPQRLEDWRSCPEKLAWQCRACQHTGQLTDLNFRKSAGFGRNFLEIWGIYPSEAVPGDELHATLRALTGGDWKTIYIGE